MKTILEGLSWGDEAGITRLLSMNVKCEGELLIHDGELKGVKKKRGSET